MEEIAQVYSRALFEVAKEHGKLDVVREQLGQFADALEQNRDLAVFFFSPYFSTDEKKEGLRRAVDGADPTFVNFLQTLLERHRMPAIYRIRAEYERLWDQERKLLPVEVTSAIDLDEATVKSIGDRIGEQTGQQVELTSRVDPSILGGIVLRVGNQILDASIKHRLDQLRKHVAQA
ncbi:ATP synthase F1 subunit delta [Conexibacter woesei]|uniref:ATP synthase subunit delta n=1 Tax=Conexibacter woesei (strain DSM 14684 / CCUG 47730 / CIP 108061 / JCM 11494 / NBRC 100937 / ID131577) TaxID=469383 RepID=D3F939_CONWI|nr:ATP synthase F1 subunit delta [Conexibacter woesei]ADB53034.1 ATP synthase F1, delta subunit [Conexibacter woesei DSM 14684]